MIAVRPERAEDREAIHLVDALRDSEAWMVLPVSSYEPSIRGTVIYPPAFDSV